MRFYYLIYLKIGTKLWQQLGLSAGTVITKETKEPNNRVLLGALLSGSFWNLKEEGRNLIQH